MHEIRHGEFQVYIPESLAKSSLNHVVFNLVEKNFFFLNKKNKNKN